MSIVDILPKYNMFKYYKFKEYVLVIFETIISILNISDR